MGGQLLNLINIIMKQSKVDSVQNFLTPSKLLTSKMKPTHKHKPPQTFIENLTSPSNANNTDNAGNTSNMPSSPRKERESYKNKNSNTIENPLANMGISQGQSNPPKQNSQKNSRAKPYEGAAPIRKIQSPPNSNFMLNTDKQKREEDFSDSRMSRNSREGGNNPKYRAVADYARSEVFLKQKQLHESNNSQNNQRNFVMPIKKNPQISQLQIKQMIQRLMSVKNQLEDEIAELKHLLDNTSNYLEHIDTEYEKVKQKILVFTSRALDAAFNQYKANLPDWSKYQNVEQAGIQKLQDINHFLGAYEQLKHSNEGKAHDFGSSYEIQKKVDSYKIFIQEVKDARAECFSKRPAISEERLRKYEAAVWQLGKF